ncbi:MAG TPA: efflux RND transporter permease subunit [Candidatus Enterocloster faecavium]|uniref:Efflux RND transporter permease subunit n=1 Tax=Candidatus Enterocloster faecavium TaxID=2838560 RepID=A0A9D2L961_9FIRM|nr:efflux RND transporter permease subunit [Candidatus Enterocloster faecavium]
MALTKYVLKRPITTIMAILCLIYFGYSSVASSTLELSPDMDMPMLMIMTTYSGASPEDVNELITTEIEDQAASLSGLKSITSTSSEGSSMVMLEYEYGTDIDEAYDDLKKQIDLIAAQLPEDADEPVIVEMSMDAQADITLSVNNSQEEDLYSYVNNEIAPEFEKISDAAEVTVRGGSEQYVKIELVQEKVKQYQLSMSSISEDIRDANLSYPAGDIRSGSQELSVSTRLDYDTVELLKEIPLTTPDGSTVYLEDVANVYTTYEDSDSIARYNGEDTISLSITKQQSSSTVDLSNAVKDTIASLTAADQDLEIVITDDGADSIIESLSSVAETIVMAIGISMVIIWLFFGDLKASLIVGSSIPVSILSALILMNLMGLTLNVITLSALTLGVGMMVDNSIVVLESCFRCTEESVGRKGFIEYMQDALKGTDLVNASILGGTVTTCVVFLPLAFLEGMTGQMFKPLGFTIVFCLSASYISALTVVPLCYMMYKPVEKKTAPLSGPVKHLQDRYRVWIRKLLPKGRMVLGISIGLLAFSLFIATKLDVELMAADDQGEVTVSVEFRPGLMTEHVDSILREIEAVIAEDSNLESYMTSYGGGRGSSASASINAQLKDDRDMETADVAEAWQKELSRIRNCDITVTTSGSMSMMTSFGESYEVILKGTDYDEVKEVSDRIVSELKEREDVAEVHSDAENASPVVEVRVDALKAKAAGFTASQIGGAVYQMVSGVESTEIKVNGEDITVRVEYADDEYQSLDQIEGAVLTTSNGSAVALTDLADIQFVDSPADISREDKEYLVTITAEYTETATEATEGQIRGEVVEPNLTSTVSIGVNSMDQSRNEEFSALFGAIGTAVFLIFVVMAAQFESPKFSLMVMTTIPFSLIGSFGLLYLADSAISMMSLVGFLMLIGTVVNSGILYVETVNQYREEMDLDTALVEAGATRMKPIFMTTSTTILSMIPMALAWGNSGSMTQGLALVNIGGLTASTILALLLLPVYYKMMSFKSDDEKLQKKKEKAARKLERSKNKRKGLLQRIVCRKGSEDQDETNDME